MKNIEICNRCGHVIKSLPDFVFVVPYGGKYGGGNVIAAIAIADNVKELEKKAFLVLEKFKNEKH